MDKQSGKGIDDRGVEAFIALQILGAVLFVFITITSFVAQCRGGSRHATFFSFCFSWIVFCISYALLTFAGQQNAPDHNLCNVHSALVYAAPLLAGSATVSLVTHLFLNVQLAFSRIAEKRRSLFVSVTLVVTPWIIWIAIFIGVLLFGFRHPELITLSPHRTYCILIKTSLPDLTSIWITLLSAILVAEEITIGFLFYRNRELLHGFSQSTTMAIRVVLFTIFGIVGVIIGLVYTETQTVAIQFELLIGTMPLAAAIIFGTQKDLLQVWVFWKKYERRTANHTDILSTRLSSFSIPEAGSHGASHTA